MTVGEGAGSPAPTVPLAEALRPLLARRVRVTVGLHDGPPIVEREETVLTLRAFPHEVDLWFGDHDYVAVRSDQLAGIEVHKHPSHGDSNDRRWVFRLGFDLVLWLEPLPEELLDDESPPERWTDEQAAKYAEAQS